MSNESNIDVFFDNLQVTHIRGPILEETHYYPFGLTMAGISSKALAFGEPENKRNKFQNQELNEELGVNYYEFKYRNHDPQIGRFIQLDPLSERYVHNSTYAFSENRVTSSVEIEGLEAKDLYRELGPVREQRAREGIPKSETTFEKAMDKVLLGMAFLIGGVVGEIIPILGTTVNVGTNAMKTEETASPAPTAETPSPTSERPTSLIEKRVPSPNGKNGGAKHQSTIKEIEKEMQAQGMETRREIKVETPGGKKGKKICGC